MLDQLI